MKSYEIRVQRLNETPDAPKLETPDAAFRYWESVITKAFCTAVIYSGPRWH